MDPNLYMGLEEKVMTRFKYKQVVTWVIVVTIFIYLGKMVWENWAQVKGASFNFRLFTLLASTLIFAFSYFIQIWAWYLITLKLGIAIPFSETLESWFYSQLGKYLPGKVWLLLSRFYFYESKGKSKKAISIALYLEAVAVILAGAIIFLGGLIIFKELRLPYSGKESGWLILLILLACIYIHPRILQKVLTWILIQFKREPVSLPISYTNILWVLFTCLLAWAIGGVGFYLFIDAVFSVSAYQILFLTGALAFSSTLGLIAVFTPSGLGVREGVLVYLLSYIMPGSVAVILSVLTRIWMILIEMGLIGVIYLVGKFQKARGERGEDV